MNADYIARGLSGRNTDVVAFEAGRIMLKRLRQLGSSGADFAFESTLYSRTFAPFLRKLQAQPVAAQLANELIITEPKTWQKLQKLSKTA